MNEHFNKVRKNLLINLVISWFIPMVLVILLRSINSNDAAALAIAGAIPVMRTIIVLVWRRRIDWIGVLGGVGFAIAFAVSTMSGGSSFPLKLYHPVVTGILGLILLVSVAIRKPLLIIIIQAFSHGNAERFKNLESRKKITNFTVLIGLVFMIDAVIHIIMAVTLSTVMYLSMSRIVTLICVLVMLGSRKLIVGQKQW